MSTTAISSSNAAANSPTRRYITSARFVHTAVEFWNNIHVIICFKQMFIKGGRAEKVFLFRVCLEKIKLEWWRGREIFFFPRLERASPLVNSWERELKSRKREREKEKKNSPMGFWCIPHHFYSTTSWTTIISSNDSYWQVREKEIYTSLIIRHIHTYGPHYLVFIREDARSIEYNTYNILLLDTFETDAYSE